MSEESITEDMTSILDDNEDDAELLQRLASRHYYSTTTALAITVGVGCILLILNMLIFAGIYYQRDRDKKRAAMQCTSNGQESLPMTSRTGLKTSDAQGQGQEPPPLYTTLARSPSIIQDQQLAMQARNRQCEDNRIDENDRINDQGSRNSCSNTSHKDPTPPKPPKPPTRTTSSLSTTTTGSGGGTIKKRVQIQEISV